MILVSPSLSFAGSELQHPEESHPFDREKFGQDGKWFNHAASAAAVAAAAHAAATATTTTAIASADATRHEKWRWAMGLRLRDGFLWVSFSFHLDF